MHVFSGLGGREGIGIDSFLGLFWLSLASGIFTATMMVVFMMHNTESMRLTFLFLGIFGR